VADDGNSEFCVMRLHSVLSLIFSGWIVMLSIGPLSAQDVRVVQEAVLVPSPDKTVMMRTMIYRPAAAGPYPLSIISHGTSSNAGIRAQQDLSNYVGLAHWLVQRGYLVAIPQRPGHGRTGGKWMEDYGPCDDPQYSRAGLAIAESIGAVADALSRRADVRAHELLLIGHSAGAWGSLAFASSRPGRAKAVINFSGGLGGHSYGWPNRTCAPERLIEAAADFGASAHTPTLWLYAENDSYFSPTLSTAMAESYRRAGGRVDYHLLPAVEEDGHFFVFDGHALAYWSKISDAFLRSAGLLWVRHGQHE
jgi:dienelactone hydrolase